jgi:membrane fusion protein, heavy metal efflux system
MNGESRVTLWWPVVVASAVGLLAIGAGGAYVVLKAPARSSDGEMSTGKNPGAAVASQHQAAQVDAANVPNPVSPDVVVTLSPEAVERARIVVTPVLAGSGAGTLRLPAIVEPNAYRRVAVTTLAGGRVARVLVDLGTEVRQGQTLAQVFSAELAEAQARYVSARADLDAHERELDRTGKLVEIGAASRQELERVHAEHASRRAGVESARSQLVLLGLPGSAIESLGAAGAVAATIDVAAPIDGVVTERQANVGSNVEPGAMLFTVVDRSTVWIVADLYEKDFASVRVGSVASITTAAYPALLLKGRVSYIDLQVSPETRTAKVRVEAPNARGELRFGMYAEMQVETAGQSAATLIPRSALQAAGGRQVVYLADAKEPGRFTERDVRLGQIVGDSVEALSGVSPGDLVVTAGSFLLRAEAGRAKLGSEN